MIDIREISIMNDYVLSPWEERHYTGWLYERWLSEGERIRVAVTMVITPGAVLPGIFPEAVTLGVVVRKLTRLSGQNSHKRLNWLRNNEDASVLKDLQWPAHVARSEGQWRHLTTKIKREHDRVQQSSSFSPTKRDQDIVSRARKEEGQRLERISWGRLNNLMKGGFLWVVKSGGIQCPVAARHTSLYTKVSTRAEIFCFKVVWKIHRNSGLIPRKTHSTRQWLRAKNKGKQEKVLVVDNI